MLLTECKCNGNGSLEGNTCNQDNGLCTGSCKDGYYGNKCLSMSFKLVRTPRSRSITWEIS